MMRNHGFTDEVREEPDDFSVDRLRWVIRLRWVALGGMLTAAGLAALGFYPGVSWPVLVATAVGAGLYNVLVWRRQRRSASHGASEAVRQAVTDMALLTVVLWAAGGMRTPFIGYYLFHVALLGILGGTRATVIAALAALAGSGLLLLTEHVPALQIAQWNPAWPWDLLAEGFAFVTTVGAVAYLVSHAVGELRRREREVVDARADAALELELLTNTLDELEAGLEVVGTDGQILWRNRRAEALAPAVPGKAWQCPGAHRACEKDASRVCPVSDALEGREPSHCRFAARVDGSERIYEMQVFPLGATPDAPTGVMNLYVDRTSNVVSERRLILAERLASLGRVTQGVAHELNTPLATIRTLSADMLTALRDAPVRDELVCDLEESAALVHDETRRLGRITQGLLTGRDLTASNIEGAVPLGAVIERARGIVFAGARADVEVRVDEGLDRNAVRADPDHLVQVMVNLLQNAYDAGREIGERIIRVHARRAGPRVEIMIDDNGPGMPESMRGRLFEPFATTKPPGKGTGLGLYTSYMLVTAMHGTIALEDGPQGGTRAVVGLPAAPSTGLVKIARSPMEAAE